jgi:hypothetical protein
VFELFLAPRLIAFYLRRAFRMRDPVRRGRMGAIVKSESDRKREADKEAFDRKRREALRARRANFNMVRVCPHRVRQAATAKGGACRSLSQHAWGTLVGADCVRGLTEGRGAGLDSSTWR